MYLGSQVAAVDDVKEIWSVYMKGIIVQIAFYEAEEVLREGK